MNWDKFWDMAAWIGFGVVIMYLLLKAFGVLQSPLTAAISAIIGGALYARRYMQNVTYLEHHFHELERRLLDHLQDQKVHRKAYK